MMTEMTALNIRLLEGDTWIKSRSIQYQIMYIIDTINVARQAYSLRFKRPSSKTQPAINQISPLAALYTGFPS